MSANVRQTLAGPAILCLLSCGHYADFTLPVMMNAPPPTPVTLTLQPQPILSPSPNEWDSSDVLNPSVIYHDRQFWNLYSGFDGKVKLWYTGLAVSPDGVAWTRRGRVLAPDPDSWDRGYIAANGSALWRNGEYLYWYEAGYHDGPMRIGLARSSDGLHFRKEPKPVLDLGPYQSWDERDVADPYVIEVGGWLYMYYLGQDRASRQRIGVARSRDGISWEKLRTNPVIDMAQPGSGGMSENGAGEPAVFVWRGHYWMLITGTDAHQHRSLAAFWSNDGIHWTQQPHSFSGDQAWDSVVLCDPTVIVTDDAVRVWFGGGDQARPDEGLHGQIGVGTLQ